MKASAATILIAILFTATVLALGYLSFGFWTTMIFTSGFAGGLLLWLIIPARPPYEAIRAPYWLTFGLFVIHRVEEKLAGFFAALSRLTHVPTPDILSWNVILLVALSVGAWLAVPVLLKRGIAFGYYLAWTFFAAMGITELAHFIFPLIAGGPYGYFPGMASAALLAPAAWWGLWRLGHQHS
ncbi:MAG: HXXEE domain-containing protein [Pseudomonadota bacterium]